MIFRNTWERYLFKEILKVFFLFLFSFYFLYIAIDYSTHAQDFLSGKKLNFGYVAAYYAHQFIKRADLLVPLALLVATIKVLTTLTVHHELLALQVSGLSFKKILRPFFFLATLCMLFNLFSVEYILPRSLSFIDTFYDAHFRHAHSGIKKERIHVIHLKDHSKVIYQRYDSSKNALFDAFWVRSNNDIWRMKFLKLDTVPPQGEWVDHLQRTAHGPTQILEKTESFDTRSFPELKYSSDVPKKGSIPFENRRISELYRLLFQKKSTSDYQKPEILTYLLFKTLTPFLCFLVVLAATPWCVTYSRTKSVFLLYAIALFSYITFYTLMDAAAILGANHTFSPWLAIGLPFTLCLGGFSWKCAKIR